MESEIRVKERNYVYGGGETTKPTKSVQAAGWIFIRLQCKGRMGQHKMKFDFKKDEIASGS